MQSGGELAKGPESRRRLKRPWIAMMAAGLLAAGCGTRLGDPEIRAGVFEAQPANATGVPADGLGGSQPAEAESGSGDATVGLPAVGTGGSILPGGVTSKAAAETGGSPTVGGQVPQIRGTGPAKGGRGTAPASGSGANPGGAAPTPQATAASRVTIGHIGDYSGVVGAVLGPGALGMQVATRYINDHGGLNGHPLQLIVGDAAGDPARALSLVRDMVENKGVVALVGNIWPLSASGPKSYLEEKHIPVLGGDGASTVWFASPVYFPNSPSFPIASLGAAKTSADAGKKKVAVVHCVEVEACQIWHKSINDKAGSVGAQVVYDAQVSLAQPDYTAECLQAQRNGAEGVLAAMDGNSLRRFARSCKQQGYQPLYVTMSLAMLPSTARDPNMEEVLTPSMQFPFVADDTPGAREYHEAIARYAPGEENSATASTWASGAMLREVGKALPANPKSSDFFEGVWRIKDNNFGGVTVALTYIPDQATPPPHCYFLLGVKDGRFVAPRGSKPNCI